MLLEYKQKNKSNQMVDRRFGEHEEGMTVEEKLTQRFILERKVFPTCHILVCITKQSMLMLQRKHERSGRFNLRDTDADNSTLTHFGQSIGDMEKFDSIGLSDKEMDEEMDEGDLSSSLCRYYCNTPLPLHAYTHVHRRYW